MNNVQKLYEISSSLNANRTYIFGTGLHARQTLLELWNYGIDVRGFIDRIPVNEEGSFQGLPVLSEDLSENRDASIVIASTSYREIAERLSAKGYQYLFSDRFRYSEIEVERGYLCSAGKYSFMPNIFYVLCPAGIGDTFYTAAYVRAFKEYSGTKEVFLITKESHACLARLFPAVDGVLACDQIVEHMELYSIRTKTWRLRNYLYGHFKKNLCYQFDNEYHSAQKRDALSLYRSLVWNLPGSCAMERPVFRETDDTSEVEKSAAILMPYANTAKMLPMSFWERLAETLIAHGYPTYTNVSGELEREVPGTKRLCQDLISTVVSCRRAATVVAVRSGMCDLLAWSGVNILILETDAVFFQDWNLKTFTERDGVSSIWSGDIPDEDALLETVLATALGKNQKKRDNLS